MNNLILRTLAGMSLLAVSTANMAATMDITASFAPSMDRPENNTFTNTTPQSGYCSSWPQYCSGFSILINGLSGSTKFTIPGNNNDKRQGMFFKIPNTSKNVTVTNVESNQRAIVQFRASAFGVRIQPFGERYSWGNGGHLGYPQNSGSNGCSSGAGGQYGTSGTALRFIWNYSTSATAGCYRVSDIDRPAGILFSEFNIGYQLTTPNPLDLGAGIYQGSATFSVGPGGDFDFGDNIETNDSEVTINFTLLVNHELKLTTTAENQAVSLQPCTTGRTCTEDEGQANWERWMVTRIPPQLTGRSNFNLSSSGEFTVYLECEQQSGPDCALRSDKMPSQTVPIRTLLTLPDNIVDSVTGSPVSKRPLVAGRDLTKNVFVTKTFGQNKAGSIDFKVSQKDVDTMLTTRPDTYRGAVTVIFDPKIY